MLNREEDCCNKIGASAFYFHEEFSCPNNQSVSVVVWLISSSFACSYLVSETLPADSLVYHGLFYGAPYHPIPQFEKKTSMKKFDG
jgi:hypothetical protein